MNVGTGATRAFRGGIVAMMLFGAAGSAEAQSGFTELFGNLFGGGSGGGGGGSQPLPQPEYAAPDSRPLTVRAHPRPHRHSVSTSRGGKERYDVAAIKDVTMYTDRTLTRGDAVMTPTGLKVFAGEHAPPYTDDDFIAIADAGRLSKTVRTQLIAIDDASRPEMRR